jgi:hypothetical protein
MEIMEVTFQNRLEDFDAFYDHLLRETEEGKQIGRIGFKNKNIWTIMWILLIGTFIWGATGNELIALLASAGLVIMAGGLMLLITGFNPRYYYGYQILKSQQKSISPRDLQAFQSKRTLRADDEWLEIQSSEVLHRWRWKRVEQILLSPKYVFINIGSCSAIYLPRREFRSEQDFVNFGRNLVELRERQKDKHIDAG